MIQILRTHLIKVNFSEKYASICNAYKDFENGKKIFKKQIDTVIESNNFDLEYNSKDKVYYKDYILNKFLLRFSFKIKDGMVELFYFITDKSNNEFVVKRFNSMCKIENEKFDDLVKHPVPIVSTLEGFNEVLSESLFLHNEFISTFQ
ncbi:hypothetical protein [uncultured Polaribacter sp.]|uniref:hypothetical protein n=1 Tax=uncultured Polaribacter sp. TaxID=174711 RepID=UPI0030D867FB|tara:strand:+ start:7988 stop:8431 length:444 start_codon:yes stop_codon:yes gene_type:complete